MQKAFIKSSGHVILYVINAKFYITRLNLTTSRMKNSKLTDGLVANLLYTIWLVQGCVFMITELGKAITIISF